MIERQITQRLADAGFPESSLQVESVGLRQFEVTDMSLARSPWTVQLRNATVRYHPFEIFRSELRSAHLEGLRINLDLDAGEAPPGLTAMDGTLWDRLTQRTKMQLPLRQLSIVDGLIRLNRGQHDMALPFEFSVTNDTASQQLRGVASGANPHGQVRIEGQVDRETGLRVTAQVELRDDWDSWLRLILPDELNAASEGLHMGPARCTLDLLVRPDEAETQARFTGQVDSIIFAGIHFTDARASGEYTPASAMIEGAASLGTEPFAFDLRLVADAGESSIGYAGKFSIANLRLREFQIPSQWTGELSVLVSGGLDASGRFHVVPGRRLDLEPQLDFDLERVEWLEQGLKAEGIRGSIFGTEPESPDTVHTNLVHVDRIQFHEYEATDITVGAARLNRDAFQFELVEAQLLGGRLRSTPFTAGPESGGIQTVLELEQVSLSKLARLIPQFAGSIEGHLNGRLPIQFEAGRFSLGAATLRLDHDSPARLRYPADGLLTDGIPPDSDRHEQLKLIEEALQDLQLTELVLDFQSPDHPQSPIRVRLEGTFSSAKAIIPVKFNLNVNGGVEEVLRLMSVGKIELSL
jgi:hypothetical protein